MILALFGCGGLGREVLEVALDCNANNHEYDEVVFVVTEPAEAEVNGMRVLSEAEVIATWDPRDVRFVICVGDPSARAEVASRIETGGFSLATVIHPGVTVPGSSTVGAGSVVYPGCFIGPNVRVGSNCVMIGGSVISHDCVVGDHSVLCPRVVLCGRVSVGVRAFFGAGCTVRDGVTIGDGAVVGMGAAAFSDVPNGVSAIGNPARTVRRTASDRLFQ